MTSSVVDCDVEVYTLPFPPPSSLWGFILGGEPLIKRRGTLGGRSKGSTGDSQVWVWTIQWVVESLPEMEISGRSSCEGDYENFQWASGTAAMHPNGVSNKHLNVCSRGSRKLKENKKIPLRGGAGPDVSTVEAKQETLFIRGSLTIYLIFCFYCLCFCMCVNVGI